MLAFSPKRILSCSAVAIVLGVLWKTKQNKQNKTQKQGKELSEKIEGPWVQNLSPS